MRSPSNRPAILLPLLLALLLPAPARADADEDLFGRLFQLHLTNAAADAAMAAQAARTADSLPPGPYRSAARALQGWRLLRAGKTADARAAYAALLADPATPASLAELARRWLTRLDLEQVRAALRTAWIRDIRYPESLEQLPEPRPPLKDRWDRPWSYRVRASKRLGAEGQTYDLQSTALGADSALAPALARPWPDALPVRILSVAGANPVVTFETIPPLAPHRPALSEGKSWNGLVLVKVGPKALLLVQGDHLFLPLKPGS